MAAAIFSAAIRVGKLVLAHGTTGKIEASTTRKPCTPLTRPCVSTTAIGSSGRPLRQEHEACPHADRGLAHEGFQRLIVAHHLVERKSLDNERVDHVAAQRRRP